MSLGDAARTSESQRRGLIDLGMQQINSVYGGGSAPFYQIGNRDGRRYDPNAQYYIINNRGKFKPYQRLPYSFGENFDRKFPRNQFRRGKLYEGGQTQTFEGFQPEFYQQRAKDYINFALPQVAEQYQTNRNAMTFGLANRGLQNSSVANQANSRLERVSGQARQGVADAGLAQANELERTVEQARQSDIAQLYQTADPARGMQSALANASQIRTPSAFAPLGDMFSNIARQYYTSQALNNYRGGQGATENSYALSNYIAPIQ